MSRSTCQVLYAKYNSTRRPDFRITTEICEDVKGLYVRKRAQETAAAAHLQRIHENGVSLENYYRDINVIPSEWEDGNLAFPYIKGQTLAEQIDMRHFDKGRFIAQVNEKIEKILSVKEQYVVPFKPTKEFEMRFGKAEFGNVPAMNPANIDSLLTNFVENETGIYCIDCEWVCQYPVPIDYIRYRALLYLYINQVHSMLDGVNLEEMLGWFGFSEAECQKYWQMDDCFQQFVHGEDRRNIYTERYRKRNITLADIQAQETEIQAKEVHIENLERQADILREELDAKENHVSNLQKALDLKEAHVSNLQKAVESKETHIQNLEQLAAGKENHIRNLNNQIQQLTLDYQVISNAFFWRVTKPARVALDWFKNLVSKNEKVYLTCQFAKNTLRHGLGYAKENRREYLEGKRIQEPQAWFSDEERRRQSQFKFKRNIRFSILVPLYNTPEDFLAQMIQSVLDQTYANWELCLADGSDKDHSAVKQYCMEMAHKDKRIKYTKLKENEGISGNTNACISMSTGDYIALFDHDDILYPSALFENMKVICEENADLIYSDENTFHSDPAEVYWSHFKPDYAPDTLRSYNYICHLTVFKRELLDEVGGGFRSEFDGSQDYDMILRLTEKAKRIVHIPKPLYYWRGHAGSVASDVGAKAYTVKAAKAALQEHLKRIGLKGKVLDSLIPSTYKIQYEIEGEPLISIVIPNMDHVDDLKKCIDSILGKSSWKNLEIIIVENNSRETETFEYYRSIENRREIQIATWNGGFNFSAICNFGFRAARGDYILLLNNDIQVITPDWIEQMLMFAQRRDVGAVGAMLYYPDDTVQHAGVILGIGGVAGHSHKYFKRGEYGYASRMTIAQNLSAVTAACCLIPRHVWEQVGGLDESFAVAFNDVDLCMRIRKAGYLIVWTPYAELYHFESKSRGLEDTQEKQERFKSEVEHFHERWDEMLKAGDPYYNPNLTLEREDFSFK